MAKQDSEPWRCPNCGREFAKRNQWHSCLPYAVDDHFRGKEPQLRELTEVLISRLQEFGPIRVDAVKTSINLISKHHFGGVMVRKKYLLLGFISNDEIGHERIVRTQQLGLHRVSHSIKLSTPDEIDDELLTWLRKAYNLQS